MSINTGALALLLVLIFLITEKIKKTHVKMFSYLNKCSIMSLTRGEDDFEKKQKTLKIATTMPF